MQTISDFLAPRRLFTTADLDGWLLQTGQPSRDHRRWVLAALHSTGDLARVRRGLYIRTWTDDAMPDAHHLAAWFAKDAILGLRTALEVRGIVARSTSEPQCIYFTRAGTAGFGPDWCGVTMHPIVHPTALVRAGKTTLETELLDGKGYGPLRVTTTERAFVDMLARSWVNSTWQDIITAIDAIPTLDLDRTVRYLEQLANATTTAKVGWILEARQAQFGVPASVLERIERSAPRGIRYVSRSHRQRGRYVKRWNLVVPPDARVAPLEPSYCQA
jgi:predicted transcriptional regulator of viral defense system